MTNLLGYRIIDIMFIQTETTPNPSTLKFIPGEDVLGSGTANFTDKEAAGKSPLATAIFGINNVVGVFLGSDFITVTKSESSDWSTLKTEVLTTIMEHYVAGKPIMLENGQVAEKADDSNDSEVVKQIKELIETRVRPSVAQDGGDIIFRSFEDGVVKLELHGSCSGCPSSHLEKRYRKYAEALCA
ncbi:MAG: iron transporter [Rickettsiaceae bacterium]|nr:iron transporter [Rickettsiaceae bacterium]